MNNYFVLEICLNKNFFIKDLNIKNINSYWIYNVGGVDFYIPNYGYLLLVDHSYSNDENINEYKIESKIFNPYSDSPSDIKNLVYENLKDV